MRKKNNQKRLRIFAGPNGSGKTTIIKNLPPQIPLGYYINADDIEKELRDNGTLDFGNYGVNIDLSALRQHILNSGILKKNHSPISPKYFSVIKNQLKIKGIKIDSYIAASIAEFLRLQLLSSGKSFSFETVMSHKSKIKIIQQARENKYRVYLYYVVTDSIEINLNRINLRVAKDGHGVSEDKVKKRYFKSLNLLYDAVKLSNRAYLFDNSGKYYELVAEITDGKKVEILDIDKNLPNWFFKYFYNKKIQKTLTAK